MRGNLVLRGNLQKIHWTSKLNHHKCKESHKKFRENIAKQIGKRV